MMEKNPEKRWTLRRVMTDAWYAKKPDGSSMAKNEIVVDMGHLQPNKKVEVSGEDMMQSVHQVGPIHDAGGGGGVRVRMRVHNPQNRVQNHTAKTLLLTGSPTQPHRP